MAITKIQSESLNLADTYAFTGTVTGAGQNNTPAWNAYLSSDQSLVGDTNTKINCDTEAVDTNSAYDTTNKRFTVPTGEGGSYFYYIIVKYTYDAVSQLQLRLSKNGTVVHQFNKHTQSEENPGKCMMFSGIIELAAGDYIEPFYFLGIASPSGDLTAGEKHTKFGGFKIRG